MDWAKLVSDIWAKLVRDIPILVWVVGLLALVTVGDVHYASFLANCRFYQFGLAFGPDKSCEPPRPIDPRHIVEKEKNGNNGTVSCSTFCAGKEWGGWSGTCVNAYILNGPRAGDYVGCETTTATPGGGELMCTCSVRSGA